MSLPGITGMHGLVGAVASASPPGISFGGTQGGQWDPSDLTTMFKDTAGTTPATADGDIVARINDKSGNGNHLLQSTLGNRPVLKIVGGIYYLLFDGVDDYLTCNFSGMGTTWTRVSGLQSTAANLLKCFYGGGSASDCRIQDGGGSDFIMMPDGGHVGPGFTYGPAIDYVPTELWSAAPCSLAKDNSSYVTSPSITAVDPGGITVGARGSVTAFAGMKWHGATMIGKALTGAEIATLRTLYGAKQGRTL